MSLHVSLKVHQWRYSSYVSFFPRTNLYAINGADDLQLLKNCSNMKQCCRENEGKGAIFYDSCKRDFSRSWHQVAPHRIFFAFFLQSSICHFFSLMQTKTYTRHHKIFCRRLGWKREKNFTSIRKIYREGYKCWGKLRLLIHIKFFFFYTFFYRKKRWK